MTYNGHLENQGGKQDSVCRLVPLVIKTTSNPIYTNMRGRKQGQNLMEMLQLHTGVFYDRYADTFQFYGHSRLALGTVASNKIKLKGSVIDEFIRRYLNTCAFVVGKEIILVCALVLFPGLHLHFDRHLMCVQAVRPFCAPLRLVHSLRAGLTSRASPENDSSRQIGKGLKRGNFFSLQCFLRERVYLTPRCISFHTLFNKFARILRFQLAHRSVSFSNVRFRSSQTQLHVKGN